MGKNVRRHAVNLAPRLLNKTEAAAYCGVSPATFDAACPVPPVLLADRIRRWDRVALDEWIDGLSPARGEPHEQELVEVWRNGGNGNQGARTEALPAP